MCFSTKFGTVLSYLKFSSKKYIVLLGALVLCKTQNLEFALCTIYFENVVQSKLQIYSCELVILRFVLWASRAEVLWN